MTLGFKYESVKTVSIVDSAKSQILTAIDLYVEERCDISIHTLAWSGLQILHDILQHKQGHTKYPWDGKEIYPLFFTPDTLIIKENFRNESYNLLRNARNCFKHADKNMKNKITEIQYPPSHNIVLSPVSFHISSLNFKPNFGLFSSNW